MTLEQPTLPKKSQNPKIPRKAKDNLCTVKLLETLRQNPVVIFSGWLVKHEDSEPLALSKAVKKNM